MLSSSILSRHNLTLWRHSSIEISSFSSSTLLQQSLLCYDILSVVILNLCCDKLFFVMTVFLLVAGICCHDSVVDPCIAETELCVTTDSFYVATESSLLLVLG